MKYASKLPMTLLPKAPGLRLENVTIDAETVRFSVASTYLSVACPACGRKTTRCGTSPKYSKALT